LRIRLVPEKNLALPLLCKQGEGMQIPPSPEEVDQILLTQLLPDRDIACPLSKCAGRYLRESLRADRPQPPFDRVMMDGYALRASEAGLALKVLGLLRAGEAPRELPEMEAQSWEVCTGGVLPPGADAVVPYEECEREADLLCIRTSAEVRPGQYIHPCGSDLEAGAELLSPGTRLGSRELAVAASFGYGELQVRQLPRIAILSTGDELVDPTSDPLPHQIRRSNDLAIDAALALEQLHAQTREALPDERGAMLSRLEACLPDHDLLLCSGGISKGRLDFLPECLEELGFRSVFRRVQQKPGRPMAFWTRGDKRVFCFPGNPMAVLFGLHRHLLPYLRACMGAKDAFARPEQRRLHGELPPSGLTRYLPVSLQEDGSCQPRPLQNSGDFIRPLHSDGFVCIPPEHSGDQFPYIPWS